MSEISNIVQVTIARGSKAITLPGFGIPAVIAKFAATDPTTDFTGVHAFIVVL